MRDDFVRIRYDGPSLSGHSIDVNHLAPALLAIGDLCKIANSKFNQNRASVRVLVNADLDQNCFQLDLQVVLDFYEQAKELIGIQEVSDAKEILEWLGIILPPAEFAAIGLFKFVKWLKDRKISKAELKEIEGKSVIQITVLGDNNHVNVMPEAYELFKDNKAIKSIQSIVKPLSQEGYETVEFEHKNVVSEAITKEEAKGILRIKQTDAAEDCGTQEVTAFIQVYSPVYDQSVDKWRFYYGDTHIYADISETDIAQQAFERGGAMINDTYKVRLEITQTISESGKINNHYKILEVLDFRPRINPGKQTTLGFD
jgi:hypothetical protein